MHTDSSPSSTPATEPPKRPWFKRKAVWIPAVALTGLIAISAAAGGGGDGTKATAGAPERSAQAKPPAAAEPDAPARTGVVRGSMADSYFVSGDKEAIARLDTSAVTCWYENGEPHMGATFRNGMAAHITVHVQPNYRLRSGGLHGDGLMSTEDVGIDAAATRVWEAGLGQPEGIDGQLAITECAPEIMLVELG